MDDFVNKLRDFMAAYPNCLVMVAHLRQVKDELLEIGVLEIHDSDLSDIAKFNQLRATIEQSVKMMIVLDSSFTARGARIIKELNKDVISITGGNN